MPEYLNYAMQGIAISDFVSSTQAEFDESGKFIGVNDFPTPSGWFMPASTLKKVGEFNENYRFHLDNEWLGRLSEARLKRIHMLESTAPSLKTNPTIERSCIMNVVHFSAGLCSIARHGSPNPLVKRLVHSNSGMTQIAINSEYSDISNREFENLIKRFGMVPW